MSDIIRAVRINEEIKRVVTSSRRINLVALNALLTARQAGTRSLGFAIVARELRSLAGTLEAAMSRLDLTISAPATDLAESIRERRLLSYVEVLAAAADRHHCAAATARRIRAKCAVIEQVVGNRWLLLDREVRYALRLSEFGGAPSRNARVEAASGGDMAPVLTQVAAQIEGTVGEISVSLRNVRAMATT